MNILIISTKLPYPPKDGGAIATLNLALGLAHAGAEVTMLAINTKKHYFDPDKIPEKVKSHIRFETVYRNTTPSFFKAMLNLVLSRTPYIAERFTFKALYEKLKKTIQENNFQIIQLEGPYLSGYLKTIRQYSNAKIVLRAHNVEHKIWEQHWKNETRLLHRFYLKILAARIKSMENAIISDADLTITISPDDELFFSSIIQDADFTTIPAGIHFEEYRSNSPVTANSIFFLGSLDWMPNQEGIQWFVKKVFPLVLEQAPNITFHVAGRNAPEEFLNGLNHPSIVYHGEVDDARTFMERYRIMVVPLLTGSGIRVKIIEGMAMGKCIITTSLGASGIPVTDEKNIMIANEKRRYANHIIRLIQDDEFATSLSKSAQTLIKEKFDTFALGSQLLAKYKSFL